MKNHRKVIAGVFSVMMLAGCSSGSSAASTNGADESTSGGGDLVVAFDADLNTMDPQLGSDGNSFIMQSMCLSGLFELDADGQPVNELAEDYTVSDDGMTYTFNIADAQWSNGAEVTADDFVYAWQRLGNPDTGSEYSFMLSTVHMVNAADVISGAKDVSELGVKAIDDKTLEVELSQPCDFFIGLLAFPSFFPCNQEYYESVTDLYATDNDHMIYCGPYTMTEYATGNEYTFTKNADYFKADEVKDQVDTVTFRFQQDTQSAMLDYETGNIDVVKLQGEQVDAYKDEDGFQNRLQGYIWYLCINFDTSTYADNADFQNLNLRKAMDYAINREELCENVLKDGSVAVHGIVPQDLAYNSEGTDFRDASGDLVDYDEDLAADYYAQAVEELGHDVSFKLMYEDSDASKSVAEYIQAAFENLGMEVTLDSEPKKTRLELMLNQEFQIGLTRWGPDYADPETYMDLFLTSADYNYGKYSNADYDTLVEAADSGEDAADSEARWQDYIDAEKILIQDDPAVIPVYQNGGAMMINPSVSGIEFHNAGVDSYRHVYKS